MKKPIVVLLSFSVILLSGCTAINTALSDSGGSSLGSLPSWSSESSDVASSRDLVFKVDWDKCFQDAKASVKSSNYPYVKDLYIKVDENSKKIIFSAVLDDSTNPQIALDYADTMLRQFNFCASKQDSGIGASTKTSYGGLYDVYQAQIGIAPLSLSGSQDTSKWWVYDTLPALAQTNHEIKLQKFYR